MRFCPFHIGRFDSGPSQHMQCNGLGEERSNSLL